MTKKEKNLDKIILEMKEAGTPEITHVILRSQMKKGYRKSMW